MIEVYSEIELAKSILISYVKKLPYIPLTNKIYKNKFVYTFLYCYIYKYCKN